MEQGRVLKIKPFINKYNWDRTKYPSNIDDWKTFEKIVQRLLLIFCILNKWKYVHLIFQNLTRIVKSK